MKNLFKKMVAVFMAVIAFASMQPVAAYSTVDLDSFFSSFSVSKRNGNYSFGEFEVEIDRINQNDSESLETQAATDDICLTKGDTLELKVNIKKKNENGDIVDAEPGDFPEIQWTAYPADVVELTVNSSDTRYCTIKVVSDKSSFVNITAKMGDQAKSFSIKIASLTFDKSQYYILVNDNNLLANLSAGASYYNRCYAIWAPKDSEIDGDGFEFTSSDESILKVDSGTFTKTGSNIRYYPEVTGLREGEVTLTITTSDGSTASCNVRVVGMKEYKIEAYSEDIKIPLSNSEISYNVIRANSLVTQGTEVTVKTGEDGIVKIELPDAEYYPTTLTVKSDYHTDKEYSTKDFRENEINVIPLKMSPITAEGVETGELQVAGPTFNVLGKEFDLFSIPVELSIDISNFQFKVNNDKKTIEILIGFVEFEASKYGDEEWEKSFTWIAETYKKTKDDFKEAKTLAKEFKKNAKKLKKTKSRFMLDFSIDFAGYIEMSYATGKLTFLSGGMVVNLASDFSHEFRIPAFPVVYCTIGFSVSAEGKIIFSADDVKWVKTSFSANFTPGIYVGIGAGEKKFLSTYIEGDLNGKCKLDITIPFKSWEESFTASLAASITLKGEAVGFSLINMEFPLGKDLCLYPNDKRQQVITSQSFEDIKQTAEPISREYLNRKDTVETNSIDGCYKSSVYPYATPRVVQLSDGKRLMVWTDDLGTKNDVNKATVMYSVFDGKGWSKEKPIFEDGTYNASPFICGDGENAYVVWQKANVVLPEDATMNDLMSNIDLYFSRFSNGVFSKPIKVTSSDRYETSYAVTESDGKVLITWLENSENDIFMSSGVNSVYYKTLAMDDLSEQKLVYSTTDGIESIDTTYDCDDIKICFTTRNDKNGKLFLFKNEKLETIFDGEGTYKNVLFDGDSVYYLYENSLKRLKIFDCTSEDLSVILDNFSVISQNGKTTILTLKTDGHGYDLYAVDLLDGIWSPEYQITDYGKYIRSYCAYYDNNGNIQLALNLVENDLHVGEEQAKADIVLMEGKEIPDLSMSDVIVYDDDDVNPGESIPMSIDVTNNGKTSIEGFNVCIKDSRSGITKTNIISEPIAGGETKTVSFNYLLPADLSDQEFIVSVESEFDSNDSNNATSIVFGKADLCITSCNIDNGVISGKFSNNGLTDANDVTLSIYSMSQEYIPIYEKSFDTVEVGECLSFSYTCDKQLLKHDSHLNSKLIKVSVSTTNDEKTYQNNSREFEILPVYVSGIDLDKSSVYATPNSTFVLNATVIPANATTKTVYWFSSDSSVATVDSNGVVSAVDFGEAEIKAVTSDGRFEKTCHVTVTDTIPVSGVIIDRTEAGLLINESLQLNAIIAPENATNQAVIWKSDNESIATVSETGLVFAKNEGTTTIRAKTVDGEHEATCVISVSKTIIPVTGITISPQTLRIEEGKTSQLAVRIVPAKATNQRIICTSDNPKVATVSDSGLITAISKGTTMISVKTVDGGFVATCKIRVLGISVPVDGISLSQSLISVYVGETTQLVAKISPSNATNKGVVWRSENDDVATVSDEGKVTAKSVGSTTIIAKTAESGFVAKCAVVVKAEKSIKSISVASGPEKTKYTYKKDSFDKSGMSIKVTYTDGSSEIITDTSKFTVSQLPKKVGNASLTVEYEGAKTEISAKVAYSWWQWIIVIALFGWIWY